MPRCPLCRSALVTITFGLYPIAICTSCGARWIQDGRQQRAINQIQEPSLLAQGPSLMAQGSPPRSWPPVAPSQATHTTTTLTRAHSDAGPWFLRGLAMVIHYPPARLRHNSDQPTAITDVLVATSGSSSRTGDIPLGTPTCSARSRLAAGRCTPTAIRSWSSGPAAPWPARRGRRRAGPPGGRPR